MTKIVIIDDDLDLVTPAASALAQKGFDVYTAQDATRGLSIIREQRPQLALLDLMMRGKHGFAVCQELRNDPDLDGLKIIICSAKAYPADISKAKELGADAFLVKPCEPSALIEKVESVLSPEGAKITVKFWGTRGSIPTPGPSTLRYGGNTACVEIRSGQDIVIFDCGTGARELGLSLSREFQGQRLNLHMFISHTHWDHIQGFPFFVPAYVPGNTINLYSLRGSDKSLEKVFTGQMDSSYFPVSLGDMMAKLRFVEVDGPVGIGNMRISHMYLNHPGLAIAFRVQVGSKSLVYLTDHEPYCRLSGDNIVNRKKDLEIDNFASGADLYIREAQYTDEEYPIKQGWGHSTLSDALESAHSNGAKQLAIYHHDPIRDDEAVDRMLAECRRQMEQKKMHFKCFAASDGLQLVL